METVSEAVARLRADGFETDYHLDEHGQVHDGTTAYDPADVSIVDLLRFEGMSNPSDESMVLALEAPGGDRGTLVLPYGPDMTAAQVDASRQLLVAARRD